MSVAEPSEGSRTFSALGEPGPWQEAGRRQDCPFVPRQRPPGLIQQGLGSHSIFQGPARACPFPSRAFGSRSNVWGHPGPSSFALTGREVNMPRGVGAPHPWESKAAPSTTRANRASPEESWVTLGVWVPLGYFSPSLRTGGPFVPGSPPHSRTDLPHKAEVPGLGDNPIWNQGAALWGCVFSLSKS